MNKFLIFIGGLVAGILVTIFAVYLLNKSNDDGLTGLTVFEEKGDCLTNTSKSKSSEIDVFQVLEPNAALANIRFYTDKKMYSGGDTYRDYDIKNDLVVLLINYDDKTYYDAQKIDVAKNCLRQIGSYQYKTKSELIKTVPVVVIE